METMGYLEAIATRYLCRVFDGRPLPAREKTSLSEAAARPPKPPFGSGPRFALIAAEADDASTLKGLGTYGFIKRPSAFLVGTRGEGELALEDFGYLMELLVLEATRLGLGSCWVGGAFTRSGFARAFAGREPVPELPAVIALGFPPADDDQRNHFARRAAGGGRRKAWSELFFDGSADLSFIDSPETRKELGPVAGVLDALRAAPSASNKQPWRLVRDGKTWRLHLARTPGYNSGLGMKLLKVSDLQRVDMGIAMAHASLAAAELGFGATWRRDAGVPALPGAEYVASFELG
jgi:nitroreductase